MADRRLYRPSWAAWTSLILHGVWLVVFGYVAVLGPSGRVVDVLGYRIWLPRCQTCDAASDSIRTAAEMGRLEMLSVAITVLGVVLAILAFGSFLYLRSAAMNAARDEVRDRAPDIVARELREETIARVLRNNPQVITSAAMEALRDLMEKGASEAIADDVADDIAQSFDGETDGQV